MTTENTEDPRNKTKLDRKYQARVFLATPLLNGTFQTVYSFSIFVAGRDRNCELFVSGDLSQLAKIGVNADTVRQMNIKKSFLYILLASVIFAAAGPSVFGQTHEKTLRVMTFNIKYDEPRDGINAWPNRKQMVADIIKKNDADIVGVQEALNHQLKDLEVLLPDMAWCGVGRTDGKEGGEYSAILYRKSRLKLLETKTFWLSETPDTPGSKGWDAAFPRVVTWAKFKDLRSKKEFYHFNTHFDHVGEVARVNSARLILERAANIAKKARIVVTGDFNANNETEIYRILTQSETGKPPLLADARKISETPHSGPTATFNSFKELVPDAWIDYMFVNKGIRVLRHVAIDDRPEGLWPSDHLPVLAEISFDRKKNAR